MRLVHIQAYINETKPMYEMYSCCHFIKTEKLSLLAHKKCPITNTFLSYNAIMNI